MFHAWHAVGDQFVSLHRLACSVSQCRRKLQKSQARPTYLVHFHVRPLSPLSRLHCSTLLQLHCCIRSPTFQGRHNLEELDRRRRQCVDAYAAQLASWEQGGKCTDNSATKSRQRRVSDQNFVDCPSFYLVISHLRMALCCDWFAAWSLLFVAVMNRPFVFSAPLTLSDRFTRRTSTTPWQSSPSLGSSARSTTIGESGEPPPQH